MSSDSRRVAIVQARMTSTRLPGKVLADVAGRPMLAWQLDRMKRARRLEEIVVATTVHASDDPVVALARAEGVPCFRGDEQDVLGRFLGAARQAEASVIVRVTADCPLLDPEVVDRVLDALDPGVDYASNTLQRTFPRGLDVEALHRDVLERVARLAVSRPAREHVTYFLHRERPDLFVLRSVTAETDDSDLRWTVDTELDLELVRALYAAAGVRAAEVGYRDLVERMRRDPSLRAINAGVEQKPPGA